MSKSIETTSNSPQSVRLFKKEDLVDYISIDWQPELYRFMLPIEPTKWQTYIDVLHSGEDLKEEPWSIYAVTDQNDKMIAWIQFTIDEAKNIERIRKMFNIENDALVLESASAKLFPHNTNGITYIKPDMVSARIKAENILAAKERQVSAEKMIKPRPIYISAYTYAENIPAERNLQKAGYVLLPKKIKYDISDSKKSNVWIKRIN